jgi:hypothetical protein
MSKKRAYYLEFPERNLEVMIKDNGDWQEIWTSGSRRPGVFMRMFEEDGYEVLGFKHKKRNEYEADPRAGGWKWEPIEMDSLPDMSTASRLAYYGPDEELVRAYEHDYAGRDWQ